MNVLKKIYCRAYQFVFKIMLPFLPYREPKILNDMDELAKTLLEKNIKKVMLITDKQIRSFNLTSSLEESLKTNNIDCLVYDGTNPNPTIDNVVEAKTLYLENNCECLIGFGGGSSIDCAKAVGALIAYPKKTIENLKGTLKVRRRLPLLFAIPTTAGTGSETTVTAVITDAKTHHKYTLNNFTMIPRYAILDPKLTYSLPRSLTSTTGMDALTHAVEAYIGKSTTKRTRKLSVLATKLIFDNITVAYNNPTDNAARSNMLKAAYMAGCAFTKSYVGYVHAVAHTLGGKYNTPHGLANSVILPVVLKEYGKAVHKKLYKLAILTNVADKNDSYSVAANKFIDKIINLNNEMSIPSGFDFIMKEDINMMSEFAYKEANPLYPVPKLWSREKIKEIYSLINLKK